MIDLDLSVERICGLYHSQTDMVNYSDSLKLLKVFEESMKSEGDAALEIGCRAGGSSSGFSHIAKIHKPDYTIISCDPWGSKPYNPGTFRWRNTVGIEKVDYNDIFYVSAKKNLAQFDNHILFKQDSYTFLRHTLPHFIWWRDGKQYPRTSKFLSFVFIDGMHDDKSVMEDYEGVRPFVADQAIVIFDNISYCPGTWERLNQMLPKEELEHFEEANKLIWRKNHGPKH